MVLVNVSGLLTACAALAEPGRASLVRMRSGACSRAETGGGAPRRSTLASFRVDRGRVHSGVAELLRHLTERHALAHLVNRSTVAEVAGGGFRHVTVAGGQVDDGTSPALLTDPGEAGLVGQSRLSRTRRIHLDLPHGRHRATPVMLFLNIQSTRD
jgi:hypothetical protein